MFISYVINFFRNEFDIADVTIFICVEIVS